MFLFKKVGLLLAAIFFNSKELLSAEGMPQFNADTFPSQLFWLVITFIVLYLVINFLILPRIRDNIRLRKNKISNDIERAELIKSQIDKIIQEYDLKILKSKNRANDNIKNSIEKAEQEFSSQLAIVKKRIMQKISDAEKETLEYKKNISTEMSKVAVEISSSIVNKILGKSLDKNDIDYTMFQRLIIV